MARPIKNPKNRTQDQVTDSEGLYIRIDKKTTGYNKGKNMIKKIKVTLNIPTKYNPEEIAARFISDLYENTISSGFYSVDSDFTSVKANAEVIE